MKNSIIVMLENVDRNQPYQSNWFGKSIQGNTVITDFSLKVLSTTSTLGMLIQNARTLDNDWINSYGTDNQPGGSWLIHGGTTYQTSDGCFIPNNDEYTKMQTILSSWNVRKNHEIKGNLNDPYSKSS